MKKYVYIICAILLLSNCTKKTNKLNSVLLKNIITEIKRDTILGPDNLLNQTVLIDSCYAFLSVNEFDDLPKNFNYDQNEINEKYFGKCDLNPKEGNYKGKSRILLCFSGVSNDFIKVFAFYSDENLNYLEFQDYKENINYYTVYLIFFNDNFEITKVLSNQLSSM